MLLKASEIKYLDLSTKSESDEEELFEEELYFEDSDIEFGQTILLGGYESRYLEEGEEITFEEEALDEDFELDEESGVFIGKTIVIGGVEPKEEEQEEFYQEEHQEEFDDIESLLEDEISETDYEEKVDTKKVSEEESYVDDFSNAVNSLEQSLEMAMPSWKDKKHDPMHDTSAISVLKDYRDKKEIDFTKHEFITEEQRDNLLAEAAQLVSEAKDFNEISKIMKDLEDLVVKTVEENSNYYFDVIQDEKGRILKEVESHIENVLSKQREIIQNEAEEHIESTVQFYKQKLGEDAQLLAAANNIISRREQILDEAYSRSLKLIDEANEQANRIIEDAENACQEAERIKEEAKYEGQKIEQRYRDEAEGIIADSNIESSKIIQAAEEQHQEIVEAATQDGFNVGYQEGREEAIKENAQLLMDTTNALNALHAAFPEAVKENEGKLIKLTLKVSDSILKEEIMARPEICVRVLDRAIRRVSDLEKVLIKVNPLDLDLILPKEGYFRGILPDVQDFVITGHYAIPRGGCLIETNSGTVDGQFSAQLGIVEEIFNKIRSEYDEAEDEGGAEESE